MNHRLMNYVCMVSVLLLIQDAAFALDSSCFLDSSAGWITTYPQTTNITCVCVGDGVTTLYINESAQIQNNITTEILTAGSYYINCSISDGVNYTGSSNTNTLLVNKANPILNITGSDVTYPSNVNILASETNNGDEGCNYTFYRNVAFIGNGSSVPDTLSLAAGTYNYVYNVSECSNYTSGTSTKTVTVSKASTTLTLKIDGLEQNTSFNLNSIINITAQLGMSGDVTVSSNHLGFNITNTTIVSNQTNLTTSGYFYVTAIFNGNENYSSISKTLYFDTIGPTISSVHTSDNIYGLNKNYTFNATIQDASLSQVMFEFNGSVPNYTNTTTPAIQFLNGVYTITLRDLASGTYGYRWIANDTTNKESVSSNTFTVATKQVLFITGVVNNYSSQNILSSNVSCISNDTSITNDKFGFHLTSTSSITKVPLGTSGWSFYGTYYQGNYNFLCNFTNTALNRNYTSNVTFSASVSDVTPSSSNTSNPSSSNTATGSLYFTDFKDIKVNAGSTGSQTFYLKNTYTNDLSNVNVQLSGEAADSKWCSIDAKTITVKKSSTYAIKLTCTAPSNAAIKNYSMSVRATASVGSPISSAKLIVLIALPATTTTTTQPSAQPETVTSEDTAINQEAAKEEEAPTTGFVLAPEVLPDAILVIAFLSIAVIFVFRDQVTETISRLGKNSDYSLLKKYGKNTKPEVKLKDKANEFYNKYNYKVSFGVKKQQDKKDENN